MSSVQFRYILRLRLVKGKVTKVIEHMFRPEQYITYVIHDEEKMLTELKKLYLRLKSSFKERRQRKQYMSLHISLMSNSVRRIK